MQRCLDLYGEVLHFSQRGISIRYPNLRDSSSLKQHSKLVGLKNNDALVCRGENAKRQLQ